jgi:hypothetical protein
MASSSQGQLFLALFFWDFRNCSQGNLRRNDATLKSAVLWEGEVGGTNPVHKSSCFFASFSERSLIAFYVSEHWV